MTAAIGERPPRLRVSRAFLSGDFEQASVLASAYLDPLKVEVVRDDTLRRGLVVWDAQTPGQCRLLAAHATLTVGQRLAPMLRLIAAYHASAEFTAGQVNLNLTDVGQVPGLAMCADTPSFFLIPDTDFIKSDGYRTTREAFQASTVPWKDRRSVAFWRGGMTGWGARKDWRSLQRVRLCEVAAAETPGLIDAGVTSFIHITDPAVQEEIRASGIVRDFVPMAEANRYRYQIDIDGYSNAWAALFQKLLSGSPVVKVQSRRGFRQWYYDDLVAWQNYVPVSSGMEDLGDKIRWLIQHDDVAEAIGRRGRALATAMTVETEFARVMPQIARAFRDGCT